MKSSTLKSYLRLVKALERRGRGEVSVRKAIAEKEVIVKELMDILRKYRTIGVISLEGMPTTQFKELRKALSNYGIVKVVKNTLLIKALEELKLRNYEEFSKLLSGPNAFIFTNLNAFELAKLCTSLKARRYAKPGDIATSEITIPSGPTNIPPGPSLSMFGKLKIPTQVREGFIWIAKDVTVAKPGDKVSPELASLLRKLDIRAIDVTLKLKAIYDGIVFRPEDLKLDVKSFIDEFTLAVNYAMNLAINTAIPIPEVAPLLLRKAYLNALNISVEVGLLSPENVSIALRRALDRALALASIISSKVPELGLSVVATQQQVISTEATTASEVKEEVREESKEEKRELSEEELASGLSTLFG